MEACWPPAGCTVHPPTPNGAARISRSREQEFRVYAQVVPMALQYERNLVAPLTPPRPGHARPNRARVARPRRGNRAGARGINRYHSRKYNRAVSGSGQSERGTRMLGKIPAARLALIEKIVAHADAGVPRAQARSRGGFPAGLLPRRGRRRPARASPADLARRRWPTWNSAAGARAARVLVELAPPLDGDAPTAAHRRSCAWSRRTCRSSSIPSESFSAR